MSDSPHRIETPNDQAIVASIFDMTGNRATKVQFSVRVTAQQLREAVLKDWGLPEDDATGRRVRWSLVFQSGGKWICTFAADDVIADTVREYEEGELLLLPELTAG